MSIASNLLTVESRVVDPEEIKRKTDALSQVLEQRDVKASPARQLQDGVVARILEIEPRKVFPSGAPSSNTQQPKMPPFFGGGAASKRDETINTEEQEPKKGISDKDKKTILIAGGATLAVIVLLVIMNR